MKNTPDDVVRFELYAWVGQDELGSEKLGLKQGWVPAGLVPLVSPEVDKLNTEILLKQLQHQCNVYGKTMRLCRFSFVQEINKVEPQTEDSLAEQREKIQKRMREEVEKFDQVVNGIVNGDK